MSEPWLPLAQRLIDRTDHNAVEKMYYPVYITILCYVFPPIEDYVISPQTYPVNSNRSIDIALEYDLLLDGRLVAFIEIKPERDIVNISTRFDADKQMRSRFAEVKDSISIPVLTGISALGGHCAIYRYDVRTRLLTPKENMPVNWSTVEDLAPASWWNINIRTLEGRIALNEVFLQIKAQVGEAQF